MLSKRLSAHLALLFCNIIWACDYPFYNLVLGRYVTPLAMVTASLAVAALLSLVPLLWERPERVEPKDRVKIIGNFPYNISSQIFFKVLENRDIVPECVGMIQREVAVRLAEPPGSKEYGILSVLLQAWYDIEYLFTVGEKVFNPPPKVKSAVVRLVRNNVTKLDCDEQLFIKVVKASFGQRRKMLRNSLKAAFGNFGGLEHRFFTMRAEQLSVADFVELTQWVTENR